MAVYNVVAQLQLQAPSNLNAIVSQIQNSLKGITANIAVQINPATGGNITTLNRQISSLNSTINQLTSNATKATASITNLARAFGQASSSIGSSSSSISKLNVQAASAAKNLDEAKNATEDFGRAAGLAGRRFAGFTLVAGTVLSITNALKSGVAEALKYEREFLKLSQIGGVTSNELRDLDSEIKNLSTSLGVSSKDLVQTSVVLRQAGFSVAEVKDAMKSLAETTLAPSFDNIKESTEGAIAVLAQFKLQTRQLSDAFGSINAVSAAFAVESKDIIQAVQRAGGAFRTTGGDLNEFISLFSSVRSTTRESAEAISTGLRTIFTRFQRAETVDQLKELGINLRFTREEALALGNADLTNQFVGSFEAVKRLNEGLKDLRTTDPRYSAVIEQLGGYRQISRVIPLIQEFSMAQKALTIAQSGNISVTVAAEQAQNNLLVRIDKLKEEFYALGRTIVSSDAFKGFADSVLKLASSFVSLTESLSGLIPLLTTLAAFKLSTTLGSFFTGVGKGFGGNGPKRLATGGLVPGSGSGDTVPAMLTPGEFVIKKSSARNIGYANLNKMNVKGYADGGVVTPFSSVGQGLQKFRVGNYNLSANNVKWLYQLAAAKDGGSSLIGRNQETLKKLFGPGPDKGDYTTANQIYQKLGFTANSKTGVVQTLTEMRKTLSANKAFVGNRNSGNFLNNGNLLVPFKGETIGYVASGTPGGEAGKQGRDALNAGLRLDTSSIGAISKAVNKQAGTILNEAGVKSVTGGVNVHVLSSRPTEDFEQEVVDAVGQSIQGVYQSKFGSGRVAPLSRAQVNTISGYMFEKYVEGISGRFAAGNESAFEYTRGSASSTLGKAFNKFVFPSPANETFLDVKNRYQKENNFDVVKKYINTKANDGSLAQILSNGKMTGAPSFAQTKDDKNTKLFARGGIVPGVGNSDSVSARLTPGEFVIKKSSAKAIGYDNLTNMNRYANGGIVKLKRGQTIGQISYAGETSKNESESSLAGLSNNSIFSKALNSYIANSLPRDASGKISSQDKGDVVLYRRGIVDKYIARDIVRNLTLKNKTDISKEEGLFTDIRSSIDRTIQSATGKKSSTNPLDDLNFRDTLSGFLLEGIVSSYGGISASGGTNPLDFNKLPEDALKRLKRYIKSPDGVIPNNLDAKRTAVSGRAIINKALNAGLFDLAPILKEISDTSINTTGTGALIGGRKSSAAGLSAITKNIINKGARLANGGSVDTVPAMLTPGEFVINKDSASRIGTANLHKMNKTGVAHFAKGGSVGGVQHFVAGGSVAPNVNSGNFFNNFNKAVNELVKSNKDLSDAQSKYQKDLSRFKSGDLSQEDLNLSKSNYASAYASTLETSRKKVVEDVINADKRRIQSIDKEITSTEAFNLAKEKTLKALNKNTQSLNKQAQNANIIDSAQNTLTRGEKAKNLLNSSQAGSVGLAIGASFLAPKFDLTDSEIEARAANGLSAGAGAGVGGALLGAGAGAAAGSAFGPIGTVIGGVAGALTGFSTSLSEADKKIRDLRLEKTLSDFDAKIKKINDGDNSITSSELLNGFNKGLKDVNSVLNPTKSFVQGFADNLTNVSSLFGLVNRDKSFEELRAEESKTLRQNFSSRLPDIYQFLQNDFNKIGAQFVKNAKDAGRQLSADDLKQAFDGLTKDFVNSGNGLNKKFLDLASRLQGIPIDEIVANFRKAAVSSTFDGVVKEQVNKAKLVEATYTANFNRLASAVEQASLSVLKLERASNSLSNLFDNNLAPSLLQDNTQDLNRFTNINQTPFRNALRSSANILGDSAPGAIDFGTELGNVGSKLQDALSTLASRGGLEREDIGTSLRDILEKTLGKGGANRSAIIDSIVGNISQIDDLKNKLKSNPSQVVDDLIKSVGGAFIDALQKANRDFNEASNKYIDSINKGYQRLERIGDNLDKLASLRLNPQEFSAQRRAQSLGRTDISSFISLEDSNRPISDRARRLTGLGAASEDPEAVFRELQKTQRDIAEAEKRQENARGNLNPNNPGSVKEFRDAVDSLGGLQSRAKNLNDALKDLTDATTRNAAAQRKLEEIEGQRTGRLGLAENFYSSDAQGRSEMNANIATALQAFTRGTLDTLSISQQQAAIRGFNSIGGVRSNLFGGKSGKEALDEILKNSAGGAFDLTKDQKSESEKLKDIIQGNLERAVTAQGLYTDNLKNINNELNQKMKQNFDEFIDNLRKTLAQTQIDEKKARVTALEIERGQQSETRKRISSGLGGVVSGAQLDANGRFVNAAGADKAIEQLKNRTGDISKAGDLLRETSALQQISAFADKDVSGLFNTSTQNVLRQRISETGQATFANGEFKKLVASEFEKQLSGFNLSDDFRKTLVNAGANFASKIDENFAHGKFSIFGSFDDFTKNLVNSRDALERQKFLRNLVGNRITSNSSQTDSIFGGLNIAGVDKDKLREQISTPEGLKKFLDALEQAANNPLVKLEAASDATAKSLDDLNASIKELEGRLKPKTVNENSDSFIGPKLPGSGPFVGPELPFSPIIRPDGIRDRELEERKPISKSLLNTLQMASSINPAFENTNLAPVMPNFIPNFGIDDKVARYNFGDKKPVGTIEDDKVARYNFGDKKPVGTIEDGVARYFKPNINDSLFPSTEEEDRRNREYYSRMNTPLESSDNNRLNNINGLEVLPPPNDTTKEFYKNLQSQTQTQNDSSTVFFDAVKMFNNSANILADALKAFPSTITGNFTHQVNVAVTGGEAFQQMMPALSKLIVEKSTQVLNKFISTNMPDAGPVEPEG